MALCHCDILWPTVISVPYCCPCAIVWPLVLVAGCALADISESALSDAREEWERAAAAPPALLGTHLPAERRRGDAQSGSATGPSSASPHASCRSPRPHWGY